MKDLHPNVRWKIGPVDYQGFLFSTGIIRKRQGIYQSFLVPFLVPPHMQKRASAC